MLNSVDLSGHHNGTTLSSTNKQTSKPNPQRSDKVALIPSILRYFGIYQIVSTTSWARVLLELYKEFIWVFLNQVSTFSCDSFQIECLTLVLYKILICFAILDKRGIGSELYLCLLLSWALYSRTKIFNHSCWIFFFF